MLHAIEYTERNIGKDEQNKAIVKETIRKLKKICKANGFKLEYKLPWYWK